ncbi:hypothetical protein ACFV9D_23075 [Streptomyces sp. NPDC059875]|uniref:hypothetical protein n=1 Tax=unclassified Streptomyces TaxID=2593676 RepID=UPI003668E2D5
MNTISRTFPLDPGKSARPVYEMRPVVTGADHAEAVALAEDRGRWAAARGIVLASHYADSLRDQESETVGMYEDGLLIGCLVLDWRPDLQHWGTDGREPGLFVDATHSAPGRNDQVGMLITLWLADYAARSGVPHVSCEIPWWPACEEGSLALLCHLRDLGWLILGSGSGKGGTPVSRLRLGAEARAGITALIACRVPLGSPTTAGVMSG